MTPIIFQEEEHLNLIRMLNDGQRKHFLNDPNLFKRGEVIPHLIVGCAGAGKIILVNVLVQSILEFGVTEWLVQIPTALKF